jgi:Protein of unknown function (DUF3352)
MPRKCLVGLLVVSVALALAGRWFYAQHGPDGPPILALPPAQALGFIAIPGLPQAWADLRPSKFFQQVSSPAFWQRTLGAEGYQLLIDAKRRLEHYLGLPLTEPTLDLLLGREFGLALVPSQDKMVDIIAYMRVSSTEKIAETLTRTFSQGMQEAMRQTQTVDGFEIVTLRPKDIPTSVSYAFLGSLAVLSTDRAWVIDAINAYHRTTTDRLHTTPALQAMRLESTEALLAYGYYDVERLHGYTVAKFPWATQTSSAGTLQRLQVTGKVTLKATRASDGLMVDMMAWYPSHVATPMFRQVERDGAIPPFRGVPAETFYLTHIDLLNLQGLWQLLRQLAAVGYQDDFQQMLTRFRAWAGVDLERDVLPLFTGVAGFGITAPFGAHRASPTALPGVFLTLGLTDEAKGLQLIETIGAHAGGPLFSAFLQSQLHEGHTIYYVDSPLLFVNPGYVVSHQQLILGSDISLLRHMLDAALGKTTPLTDTTGYQEIRKHFRIAGGSLTFIDVRTAVEKARDMWSPLGVLLRALMRLDQEGRTMQSLPGDLRVLLVLLRPLRYIGVASQAEAQGMRTEAFVAIQDLQ